MTEVTLNNITTPTNLICFNACPNILTITNSNVTKAYASIRINVKSLYPTDSSKPSKIVVNGYTINSTDDVQKTQAKRFYRNTRTGDFGFVAVSIVNALKNIPQLSVNYNILYEGDGIFVITAKNCGAKYNISITTDNLTNFSRLSSTNGSTTDNLSGQYFSRVYVDLYYNDDSAKLINSSTLQGNYKFLTTLQKEYYEDSISFNLTPALLSVANNDNTTIWKAEIYAMVDGTTVNLGTIKDNYVINGYLVNQGGTFINANGVTNKTIPALNVSRGEEKSQYNNSTLYVYEPKIDISLYRVNGVQNEQVTINYLESDEIISDTKSQILVLNENKNIDMYTINLDEDLLRDSHFVDLIFSFGTLRYNVINPPYSMIENNRIYWYNSYGGVSFFDFVGDKKEERKTTTETYNKSLLDYYKNDKQEQEIIYFRENDVTITLSTHLIDKDGLYQLYDLHNSYKAWVTINGVNYYIIVTSLSVDEPSDNVFEATIKYNFSLLDSFA